MVNRAFIYTLALSCIAGLLLIESCKKEDTQDPEVQLVGEDTLELNSGYYTEFGATAIDNGRWRTCSGNFKSFKS